MAVLIGIAVVGPRQLLPCCSDTPTYAGIGWRWSWSRREATCLFRVCTIPDSCGSCLGATLARLSVLVRRRPSRGPWLGVGWYSENSAELRLPQNGRGPGGGELRPSFWCCGTDCGSDSCALKRSAFRNASTSSDRDARSASPCRGPSRFQRRALLRQFQSK